MSKPRHTCTERALEIMPSYPQPFPIAGGGGGASKMDSTIEQVRYANFLRVSVVVDVRVANVGKLTGQPSK